MNGLKICINTEGAVVFDVIPFLDDFKDCEYNPRERYNDAVRDDDVGLVLMIDGGKNKIGYCSYFVCESTAYNEDKIICAFNIDYIYIREGSRGAKYSNIMIPYVVGGIFSVCQSIKSKCDAKGVELFDGSHYVSPFGEVFGNRVYDDVSALIRCE